jgi:hypothetical protein
MLPVKKQDTEREVTFPATSGGFGKVLGSIQGLQQRLGDFSYGEVSIAEAKVKMLVKQLTSLRDNLESLARLKFDVEQINQRVSDIPTASFDQVTPDSLEKHPQLYAILQASKLVSMPRMNVEREPTNPTPSPKANTNSTGQEPDANLAAAETAVAPSRTVEKKVAAKADRATTPVGAAERRDDPSPVTKYRIVARYRDPSASAEEPPMFTIPDETLVESDDAPAGQAKDWSFDPRELTLNTTEASSAPINFEFPAEAADEPKPVIKNSAKIKPSPAESSSAAPTTTPASNTYQTVQAKTAATARDIPGPKPAPAKPEAKLDASKALVPANHDFDQRLLDDVIKNYGDFATAPNLPATLERTTKIVPATNAAAKTTKVEYAEAAAAARKVHDVKKSGDLDRQLKKIIKDYGEYDIYQRKSVVSLKAGGIVAFAVLGIVLAMLYLFRASAAVPAPQAGSATAPTTAVRNEPTRTTKGSADDESRVVPEAANSGSNNLMESKQNP